MSEFQIGETECISAFAHPSRVGDDDVDAGEELSRLHEGERVRRAPLRQRHAVVPQRAQVAVHRRRVGRGGALQAPEGRNDNSFHHSRSLKRLDRRAPVDVWKMRPKRVSKVA